MKTSRDNERALDERDLAILDAIDAGVSRRQIAARFGVPVTFPTRLWQAVNRDLAKSEGRA